MAACRLTPPNLKTFSKVLEKNNPFIEFSKYFV
jgi:hypothetical protein